MTATLKPSGYRNNPALITANAPGGWKGSPVDSRGRFLNLEYPFVPTLANVIRWKLQRNPYKKEKEAEQWNPEVFNNSSWIKGSDNMIVWLGHSSYYMRMDGVRLMIDPVFGDIWTAKRKSKMPLDPHLFTDVDFILLSHDHRDHMDEKSLQLLAKQNPDVIYLAGLGSEKLIRDFTDSGSIETAGWYQQYNTGEKPITITFVPSRHWARRGVFDTNKRLWGGFVIEAGGKTILFAGDSGYDSHFGQLKTLFGSFDYAIMGIGAYLPSWFMSPMHQSPAEALRSFAKLNAAQFIPMHYGTFDLSDEPLSLPLKDLNAATKAASLSEQLSILRIGQPMSL